MHTKESNLKKAIEQIDFEEIEDFCETRVFSRGENYFNDGAVLVAEYSSDFQTLTAEVEGTEDYHCTIRLVDSEIISDCSCPYDGFCKHLVAVFLFAIQEDVGVAMEKSAPGLKSSFGDYIQSLSKESLAELVMKFTPEEYRHEIENGFAGKDYAITQFLQVKKKIGQLFQDDRLLYNPTAFESALMKNINLLRGLTKTIPDEIGDLILLIINKTDEAFDQGYLYSDDHYSDDYFVSPDFEQFVLDYLKQLQFEPRTNIICKIAILLGQASYSTFDYLGRSLHKLFEQQDRLPLKNLLISNLKEHPVLLIEQYYSTLRSDLMDEERELVLKALCANSGNWVLELCELYEKNKRLTDALKLIKLHLGSNFDQSLHWGNKDLFIKYLDLLAADGQDTYPFSLQAITACPKCDILIKISGLQNENTAEHEKIVEANNPGQLLEFYTRTNRINEAHQLVLRCKTLSEYDVIGFYKKFKKEFPVDAADFFVKIIMNNLGEAKNRQYENIVDALKQLRQFNGELFVKLVIDIRQNYKRRGNLIKMMSDLL